MAFRWQTLSLLGQDPRILPHVREFITSQGRMKFVRPLYRALRSTEMGRQLAINTFDQFKDT